MNDIIWKNIPIEEFKNSYELSNMGQVRNKNTLKIKTTQIGSTGYIVVRLDTGKYKKTFQIHNLVAKAFIKPIEEKNNKKIIVKIKDGNKNNICANNLQWEYQNAATDGDFPNVQNNFVQNINEEITINNFKGKKISNFPNYLISKQGQVYSTKTNKIRKIEINNNGYCRIRLMDIANKDKKFYVHRLVAEAYIPNPNNYNQVNHIDFNKHNNNVENLEWCNETMNMLHNAHNKPENSRKVIQCDPLDKTKIIGIYNSIKEASIKTKINNTSIIHCCSGKYKKAGSFVWKYAN